MRAAASLLLIACLAAHASAPREAAASGPDAVSPARFANARAMTPLGRERYAERRGVLVSDPDRRRLVFDADGRNVAEVPYERVSTIHFERTNVPHRAFGRSSVVLVIHERGADDAGAVLLVRWLSGDDAKPALETLARHLGRRVPEVARRRSFAGLALYIAPGDTVFVTDRRGRREKALVRRVGDDALETSSLEAADPPRAWSAGEVRKVELGHLRLEHNSRFTGLGIVLGTLVGAFVSFSQAVDGQGEGAWLAFPAGAMLGGWLGTRVDVHRTKVVFDAR
jgi:hypothetical protein